MRIDRVKLIAEMARREIGVNELALKAGVSRSSVTALRGGKSGHVNTIKHVAQALGVTVEELMEDTHV